jgi:hypothetical protein
MPGRSLIVYVRPSADALHDDASEGSVRRVPVDMDQVGEEPILDRPGRVVGHQDRIERLRGGSLRDHERWSTARDLPPRAGRPRRRTSGQADEEANGNASSAHPRRPRRARRDRHVS